MFIENSVGIIETFNEPVSNWVRHSLVAVTFFEVESCPGKGVLNMVDDSWL